MIKPFILSTLLLAGASNTAFADEAASLKITNFIGTLDISVAPGPITINGEKAGTVSGGKYSKHIDGNETLQSVNCRRSKGNIQLSLGGWNWNKRVGGYKNLNDYPKLEITIPEGTNLALSKSVVFGQVGDLGSADLAISSCGELSMGNVDGLLDLRVSGSADVTAGNIGEAKVRISGSGDLDAGEMGASVIRVSGSGDIHTDSITGPAKITLTGSGDVEIGTLTGDLAYEGRGSSNLSIEELSGRVSIRQSGSGDVDINDGTSPLMLITTSGSGNVSFGGTVGDITADIGGSSDVEIDKVTGQMAIDRSGSASAEIGNNHFGR